MLVADAMRIPGFTNLETLQASAKAVVLRGQQVSDQRRVILKQLADAYPTPEQLASFRQEYELNRLARPQSEVTRLERIEERWVMVLEDRGGVSLDRLGVAGRLDTTKLLALAARVAAELARIHTLGIIHRDINPSNIVVDRSTGEVEIIDFSASSLLPRQSAGFTGTSVIQGTLAYIAPEQTGRLNRALDHRADLYSLGATLYHLAVGEVPFTTEDPVELVYAHIAVVPRPPHELRPALPAVVSAIITKLLAKNADDRYQTAEGLLHDLRRCLEQAERGGPIELPRLGEGDRSLRFAIPDHLYGREVELASLLAAFDRVSRGAAEIAVIAGQPGIGKSALVRELYRPITRERGIFIAGKFDQFNRNIPYASLFQAFRALGRLLLTDPPEAIAEWRRQILEAVGANGQLLIREIPEVGHILGPQPDLPVLRPEDAQNRFRLTFQAFVQVFARARHPLVLFLDDLQWADRASLDLLETLAGSPSAGHMLVIVAHRSNEVDLSHPLLSTLDRLRRVGVHFTEIELAPLRPEHIAALLHDAVDAPADEAAPLAALVHSKTAGNPFFVGEFLRRLHEDGLITLDLARHRWTWDIERIRRSTITENVVELMAQKLRSLDAEALATVTLASVLGGRFELRALLATAERPPRSTAAALWRALEAGFVGAEGEVVALRTLDIDDASAAPPCEFHFAHDRVQQAAYALIPDGERPALHRRVGRHLLTSADEGSLGAAIFDIVGHLNIGRDPGATWTEREELAGLNLRAAERAQGASAFAAANAYFATGAELLGADGWTRARDLAFALNLGAAESSCMLREFAAMEARAQELDAHARGPLERVRVQEIRIQARTLQLELVPAVRLAVDALRDIGLRMPRSPSKLDVMLSVVRTKIALAGTDVATLSRLPEATDPLVKARAQVMANVISAAYRGSTNSFLLIVLEMVKLSIRHGNTPASGFAYACYGLILSGALGDAAGGTALVPVVTAMLDRPETRPFKAKTLFALGAFVLPWSVHLEVCAERLYDGFRSGLEVGDLEFAAHCGYLRSYFRLRTADDLAELCVDLERMVTALRPLNEGRADELCSLYLQVARCLRGEATDPAVLVGPGFDIHANLELSLRLVDKRAIVEACLQRMVVAFILGDMAGAREAAAPIPAHLEDLPGFPPGCESRFFDALILLADLHALRGPERRAAQRRIAGDLKALRRWAAASPINYAHMHLLVEAELARAEGRDGDARGLYERAIAAAVDHRLLRDEGIACELAARFHEGIGGGDLAQHYLRRAHRAFLRWGALAKVEALELANPSLVASRALPAEIGRNVTVHATVALDSALDLSSVLRASQAIASELVLDRLVDTLIRVVMTAAGADRGVLFQERAGAWQRTVDGRIGADGMVTERDLPATADQVALTVLHYVARTRETVVRDIVPGAAQDDPYLRGSRVRSLLCMPLVNQTRLVGLLYLENAAGEGVFHEARLAFLRTLAGQMAVALENSDLFANLERKVDLRTRELQQANESLVSSNRELDAFARTVAHDLKNPLGTIAGYARYLLDDLGDIDQAELVEVLGKIEATGAQTVRIVNELLLLASVRKGDVKMVPVDMGDVVDGALRRLDGLVREYGAEIRRPAKWPTALGHAAWIEEIWANYISNALKYGGHPPLVELGSRELDDASICFWVRDNGAGIPESEQARVFAEFSRLEGVRAEGHGLGLSIVKRIADRLDGVVGLTSEVGNGSVFFFTLPRSPQT